MTRVTKPVAIVLDWAGLVWITNPCKIVDTHRPPSRMLNRCPLSSANGLYISHTISTLSPGMAILLDASSAPSGQLKHAASSAIRQKEHSMIGEQGHTGCSDIDLWSVVFMEASVPTALLLGEDVH